jgi:hypothetical protein
MVDKIEMCLEAYDKADKSTIWGKRMALQPLYDYFQLLVLHVSSQVDFDEKIISKMMIKQRWKYVSSKLLLVDNNLERWNEIINILNQSRQHVAHNDLEVPNIKNLDKVRLQAKKFKTWLFETAKKYQESKKSYTFTTAFISHIDGLYMSLLFIQEQIHRGDRDYIKKTSNLEFLNNVDNVIKDYKKRFDKPDVRELEIEDLQLLLNMRQLDAEWNSREYALLALDKCPMCNSNIKETQKDLGIDYGDGSPTSIKYRVGCEKCSYTLNEEVIDI